jgi:hypothetical protein
LNPEDDVAFIPPMVTDEYFSWTPNIAHKDGSKFLDEDEKKKSFLESIFLDLI